ncbi:protein NO VEIN domain-containing protein [Nocardioides sp. NPDC051685]|uniref:protein NO VEIN domain-containing protein n=1 Tax=Nocardioides sp. NPDC051685 TaxID=3364334 RepID=UPI0037AC8C6E
MSSLDGISTLSRTSDHLGVLANVLKDLGGGATLLNELVQNADDAAADSIRFTASTEELAVWNSGEFTDCGDQGSLRCAWKDEGRKSCDLHSFRQVGGRHKEGSSATTGAFGVGFTAVYQVTDHPELVSGGHHLILDESANEQERIQICSSGCGRDHQTAGTSFYLPWARTDSTLRSGLSVDVLDDVAIERLTSALHDNAQGAAVFLTHVTEIGVSGGGQTTTVTRVHDGDQLLIEVAQVGDGFKPVLDTIEWLVIEGRAEQAGSLKEANEQIAADRSDLIQIALPVDDETVIGRIYAGLPTETRAGWRAHINASFFPRQDRKSVEFDLPNFRARWNDMLIEASARIMASRLEDIASSAGYPAAWSFLEAAEKVSRAIPSGEYPESFSAYFILAVEAGSTSRIALLADGSVRTPEGCLVGRASGVGDAMDVLTALGLPLADDSIRSSILQITRSAYGISELTATDIVEALQAKGFTKPWQLPRGSFTTAGQVDKLLVLLEQLSGRGGRSDLGKVGAKAVAVIPCRDGSYAPAANTFRLSGSDLALFELLDPDVKVADKDRLHELSAGMLALCRELDVSEALSIFEADVEALEAVHSDVLDWLEKHREALEDPAIQGRVRQLSIFPSAGGSLRSLDELSLPSDFQDVIGVAEVVDLKAAAGHENLLTLLGARRLDAVEYVRRHLIPSAADGLVALEQLPAVLEFVRVEMPYLDHAGGVQGELSRVPLVLCTDGAVRPAQEVHLASKALDLIDPECPVADLASLGSDILSTLAWLGVAETPRDDVLCTAAQRIATGDDDPRTDVVLAILDSIHGPTDGAYPASLTSLRTSTWLPVAGGGRAAPAEIYATYQAYLFTSQGKHLALHVSEQQRRRGLLQWLGVNLAPTTQMVIAHLLHCAQYGLAVNDQVYRALGEAKEVELVTRLRDRRCIQVSPGEYLEPGKVFWSDPGLGRWARQLPPGQRSNEEFYDRVGVTHLPTPQQIETILRTISRELGNDPLDEADQGVVHRCWELLEDALSDAERHDETLTVLNHLAPVKSALNDRGLLAQPNRLLFLDGRRIAEKIELIRHDLVRRDRTTQRALTTAGVRPAEEVIKTVVDDTLESSSAHALTARLHERAPALRRLLEAQDSDEFDYDIQRLAEVEVHVVPDLSIAYHVNYANQRYQTASEAAEAVFLEESAQIMVRSETPTRSLAREVARCLGPDLDVSGIAPALHEVLSADELSESMALLDEYGVPDLDDTTWGHVETVVSVEADDDLGDWAGTPPGSLVEAPEADASDTGVGETQAIGSISETTDGDRPERSTRKTRGAGSEHRRKPGGGRRDYMYSYVRHDERNREHGEEYGDEAPDNSSVDAAGVRRVLGYERSCGRIPEEQDHSNPGFDILSHNTAGEVVRRIEVKSIRASWTTFGVWLSARQLDENREKDDFWLYVVEHAEDDDAYAIHRIKDPLRHVTKFGFDKGWQGLREPDLARNPAGKLVVSNTRDLLNWGESEADE